MKQKTRNQIIYGILIGLVIVIILQYFLYGKKDKDYNVQTQVQNIIQEKEDPNCPNEEGKLCDTRQRIITSYSNICEKKKLLSDMSADYIQDLSRCFINGIYCEKVSGFVCHKTSQQKIWYGDSCKKANLEKIGYVEC